MSIQIDGKNENGTLIEIGKRLKNVRESLNFTLEALREETGISRSYLSDFERGLKLPTSKYLLYLIESHAVDLNFILIGEGEMFFREAVDGEKVYDFGKYEEEIDDLLFHIVKIPAALHAVLAHFSEYKTEKEDFLKDYLEKLTSR
jgi:transcriptional regulator with XRE-family HTH domain